MCGASMGEHAPESNQLSPWPPVWDMMLTESFTRGPRTSPVARECLRPASAPPASRTVVTPASSVRRMLSTER